MTGAGISMLGAGISNRRGDPFSEAAWRRRTFARACSLSSSIDQPFPLSLGVFQCLVVADQIRFGLRPQQLVLLLVTFTGRIRHAHAAVLLRWLRVLQGRRFRLVAGEER